MSALCARTGHIKQRLLIEPGRALVGNSGILLTQIEYLKHTPARNFAIVDAAMNDLMRPALYDAYHEILPVIKRNGDVQNYGMSMSSNYNTRPRAAEIMIDQDTIHVIRQRETIDQLIANERILP